MLSLTGHACVMVCLLFGLAAVHPRHIEFRQTNILKKKALPFHRNVTQFCNSSNVPGTPREFWNTMRNRIREIRIPIRRLINKYRVVRLQNVSQHPTPDYIFPIHTNSAPSTLQQLGQKRTDKIVRDEWYEIPSITLFEDDSQPQKEKQHTRVRRTTNDEYFAYLRQQLVEYFLSTYMAYHLELRTRQYTNLTTYTTDTIHVSNRLKSMICTAKRLMTVERDFNTTALNKFIEDLTRVWDRNRNNLNRLDYFAYVLYSQLLTFVNRMANVFGVN